MNSDLTYAVGDNVQYHFNPGIVIASFLVSLGGSIVTIELLNKRSYDSDWLKVLELTGCASSMAILSVWCMHYIGNRAIVMGHGEANLQFLYSPGSSVVSVVVPLAMLLCAFLVAEQRYRGQISLILSLIVSGIISGLAVVSMHNIGNLGIENYSVSFSNYRIGWAIVIACVGCVSALSFFFIRRDMWQSKLGLRLGCAATIALAITGMHFEASIATQYQLKSLKGGHPEGRVTNIIVATVLSCLTISVCIIIGYISHRRSKALLERAQQVLLVSVTFDEMHQVLVTWEGHLPTQLMTIPNNQMAFEEDFNLRHGDFKWIFQVSHNWSSISNWLPTMSRHLNAIRFSNSPSIVTSDTSSEGGDYSVIFRESFCVAAQQLATALNEDYRELGTLHPGIMMSGLDTVELHVAVKKSLLGYLLRIAASIGRFFLPRTRVRIADVERNDGLATFGKGQVLFLTRCVTGCTIAQTSGDSFRWVEPERVIRTIASQLNVRSEEVEDVLKRVRQTALNNVSSLTTGTHIGLFALRPSVHGRDFDVLVDAVHPNSLPCVRWSTFSMNPGRLELLQQLDGLTADDCQLWLHNKCLASWDENSQFWIMLEASILQLKQLVREPFFDKAIFSAKKREVQSSNPGYPLPATYNLFAFHIVLDVHQRALTNLPSAVSYIPLGFLHCQHDVQPHSRSYGRFAAGLRRDWSSRYSCEDGRPRGLVKALVYRNVALSVVEMLEKGASVQKLAFGLWGRPQADATAASTEIELKEYVGASTRRTNGPGVSSLSTAPFGGVFVSQAVSVEHEAEAYGGGVAEFEAVPSLTRGGHTTTARASALPDDERENTWLDELRGVSQRRRNVGNLPVVSLF